MQVLPAKVTVLASKIIVHFCIRPAGKTSFSKLSYVKRSESFGNTHSFENPHGRGGFVVRRLRYENDDLRGKSAAHRKNAI